MKKSWTSKKHINNVWTLITIYVNIQGIFKHRGSLKGTELRGEGGVCRKLYNKIGLCVYIVFASQAVGLWGLVSIQ